MSFWDDLARAFGAPALPPQAVPNMEDPSHPLYKQRHGGSLATGAVDGLMELLTRPGEVYAGRADPMDAEKAWEMAGGIGLGNLPRLAGKAVPGEAEFGIFGGLGAMTADWNKAKEARRLFDNGVGEENIWFQTGWGFGPEGRARFEIDDSTAAFKDMASVPTNPRTVGDWLQHPEFFAAYPGARDIPLRWEKMGDYDEGYFDPNAEGLIALNARRSQPEALSTLLHELQHYVQRVEGFTPGYNPDSAVATALDRASPEFIEAFMRLPQPEQESIAFNLYRSIAGETEARNVQNRQGWDRFMREAISPRETEDVPRHLQIILDP